MASSHVDLKEIPPQKKPSPFPAWAGGIGFTFIVALIGYGLSEIPGIHRIGSMACSIILAVIYRQIFGYPEKLRPGITFASKKLLRYAIVLYGLKLNVDVILSQGIPLLAQDAFTIAFAMFFTILISKWLKADFSLSLLLGVGTGVCGASAIATVSPITRSKEEDTAISVAIISLIGTAFALIYTVIRPWLPLSGTGYGMWAGISLHEIANVALAGAPAGQGPLAMALLAKLGRVLLLVPLSFILMFWMNRRKKNEQGSHSKLQFPWFLIGFIIMSLIGSYVIGNFIQVPASLLAGIGNLSHFVLTMAMVGLGLQVSFQTIRAKALRPLLAVAITSVLLSVVTFLSVDLFF